MLPAKLTTAFSSSADAAEISSRKSRLIIFLCRGNSSGMKSSCGLFRWAHCSQIDFRVSVIARLFEHKFRVLGGCPHFEPNYLIQRAPFEKEIPRTSILEIVIKRVGREAGGGYGKPSLTEFEVDNPSAVLEIWRLLGLQ